MVTARCFCGLFTISVSGSFGEVRYCHCGQCRRKSGTAFTANARINKSQYSLSGPAELITEYEHSPGIYNAFCSKCGSPLFARLEAEPEAIRVRLGGFEGEVDVVPSGHVWVSSKASWYEIGEQLPEYAEGYTSDEQP